MKNRSKIASSKPILPFLKWAGGKRWLGAKVGSTFPTNFDRFIEPFLGGGAVFFHMEPEKAILADLNADLIEVYSVIRERWRELEKELEFHQRAHSKTYYYEVRSNVPESPVLRAARFLYLNRTCWNGLYRVNLKGTFNVPIGTKTTVILTTDNFKRSAELLEGAKLIVADFEEIIDKARCEDFLYVDPPFTVKHNLNNFRKYNENIFSWDDQIRLRNSLVRARDRGAIIILSNADHKEIRDLYRGFGAIKGVSRHSVLAADSAKRKKTSELVITANC